MASAKGNRIFAICILILGVTYLWSTWRIQPIRIGDPVGPKAFPTLIGIGVILSGLGILYESWIAKGDDEKSSRPETVHNVLAVLGVLIWLTSYVLLLEPLGFLIACSIFLLGLTAYFHRGYWATNLAVSIAIPVGIYFVFTRLLMVQLPRGVLPF